MRWRKSESPIRHRARSVNGGTATVTTLARLAFAYRRRLANTGSPADLTAMIERAGQGLARVGPGDPYRDLLSGIVSAGYEQRYESDRNLADLDAAIAAREAAADRLPSGVHPPGVRVPAGRLPARCHAVAGQRPGGRDGRAAFLPSAR